MILRRLGFVAMVIYALSLAGAIAAQPRPPRPKSDPTTIPFQRPPTRAAERIGFAINLHHTDKLHLYLESIDEMAQLGGASLEILTPVFCENGASDALAIEIGPGRGPTRQDILALLYHARRHGMTTTLMPVVLFTHPRGNEWRGKISPENWSAWWSSYRLAISYFLDIANEAGVDIFCIGSELLSTERQVDHWHNLIAHARGRFQGKLMYSTNWDHYQVPALWQELDYIGISGYWDMTTLAGDKPVSNAQLADRCREIQTRLFDFAQRQGKPIILTEVGYPSLPWALKEPWNYVNSKSAAADPQAQARGYQAFLEAWREPVRKSPHLAGIYFYEWDPYRRGGTGDFGYGIRGKPAYALVQQWMLDVTR